MSDNITVAKIDADVSGVTKGAQEIVQAGVIAEKGFDKMAAGSEKVTKASKQVQVETSKELATVVKAEAGKMTARQKASIAKIQQATVEAKTVNAQAQQELTQVEQAEKRKTNLSETRAKQRLVTTKATAEQELMITKSSLRAEEMANKQALNIELLNVKADIRAVQDAEKAKQAAQKQTHQKQMQMLNQQMQAQAIASRGGGGGIRTGQTLGGLGGGGGGGGGIGIGTTPPSTPPGGGGGGGIGNALTQVGSGLGGVAGGVVGLAGSLLTADIPGIIVSLVNLNKALVDTAKQLFAAGVAAEKTAVAYQRQVVAATNLAGGQQNLAKMMDAYVEASGGAVDQTEALTNMIQLQSLGFAKNESQVKQFVTAARGISLAMGKSVDEVTNEIALAIGNLSTRRLDQLGLSIAEVTTRTDELQKANVGMARQMAFEQAIIEAATKKFGALAQSAIGQKSPVERMEADWKNFALIMSTLVTPAVDKVADALDGLIKKGTDAALQQTLENLRSTPVPGTQNKNPATSPFSSGTDMSLTDLETRRQKLLSDRAINQQALNKPSPFVVGGMGQFQDNINKIDKELAELGNDLARANATFMLNASKVPGGPSLPSSGNPMLMPGHNTGENEGPIGIKKFEEQDIDMIVEHRQKQLEIDDKAYTEMFNADQDYQDSVTKSNKSFNQQMAEQAEDHNRQLEREEQAYQDQVEKIHRDADAQALKAARNLDEQIDREKRDASIEQGKWLRDYNESVANNTRDEKHQETLATREFNEQKTKEEEGYNKKVKDINDKFNEENAKARRAHYDNLLDAASHLDAVAVYNEQRRFARESQEREKDHNKDLADSKEAHDTQVKDAKSAYDEQIKDMQDANNQRNLDEKAAYDQRVSDANDALQQQISDQQDALAQQLEDAKTADDQRLSDMQTAHENQKTQEETDYGLQLTRQKNHHTDELTELDTQHDKRIDQIKKQQAAEQLTLENEWNKQMASEGIRSVAFIKQQNALQETSLAIFQQWWKNQNNIMKGTPLEPGDTTLEDALVGQLLQYGDDLTTQMGTAVARMDSAEITRLNGLLAQINDALAPYGKHLPGWEVGGVNPASADNVVIQTDSPPVVSSSAVSSGSAQSYGGYTVAIDTITISLGDIGNRTDNDLKKLVGDAMVYWVGEAAKSSNQTRW